MNKQKILKILNQLKPHRELAEGMIALIEAGFMTYLVFPCMCFLFFMHGNKKNYIYIPYRNLSFTN